MGSWRACAAALAAESEPATNRVMTLEDCLQMALQHNFDVQIRRYSPQIARYNLEVSEWEHREYFDLF